jgi:xanthine/uracil permease
MRGRRLSPGWGVLLIAVGLFTAFALGDIIPGMVLAGWVVAFTGMMALSRGESPASGDRPR